MIAGVGARTRASVPVSWRRDRHKRRPRGFGFAELLVLHVRVDGSGTYGFLAPSHVLLLLDQLTYKPIFLLFSGFFAAIDNVFLEWLLDFICVTGMRLQRIRPQSAPAFLQLA